MICHCQVVNDHTIRSVIADGACAAEELADRCGAGTRCGGCLPALEDLLDEAACGRGRLARPVAAAG